MNQNCTAEFCKKLLILKKVSEVQKPHLNQINN
jgi:hypothetical protein